MCRDSARRQLSEQASAVDRSTSALSNITNTPVATSPAAGQKEVEVLRTEQGLDDLRAEQDVEALRAENAAQGLAALRAEEDVDALRTENAAQAARVQELEGKLVEKTKLYDERLRAVFEQVAAMDAQFSAVSVRPSISCVVAAAQMSRCILCSCCLSASSSPPHCNVDIPLISTVAPLLFGKPLLNNVRRFDPVQLQKRLDC